MYVHIPFCARRCDYCDFVTYADREEEIVPYVEALGDHLRRGAAHHTAADVTFGSVFVGGGTPTFIPPQLLGEVLQAVRCHQLSSDVEFTVEANPETVTPEVADTLAAAGVTRVSLGAQSFDQDVLDVLGRWHDPKVVATAVQELRTAGISRLSLDLIFGAPGESDRSWRRSLETALDLEVTHLSAYALTVESNTPYATRVRKNSALAPDEDTQAERMQIADSILSQAGLTRYEISNWAVPGHESRHNLTYWRGGQWAAYGTGAHGSWDHPQRGRRRWWLLRDPGRYADAVAAGHEPLGGEEWPDAAARRLEALMMGLRITEGVPLGEIEPVARDRVERLEGAGLVWCDGERLGLTSRGFAVADGVIRELV